MLRAYQYIHLFCLTLLVLTGRFHKTSEQRMSITRRRSKLWVELRSYKPWVVWQLNDFHQLVIRRTAGQTQTRSLNLFQQHVVYFIAMAMTFNDSW